MRRAIAIAAAVAIAALVFVLIRRTPAPPHRPTTATALGGRGERAHPAPPLRLPTATARADAEAKAGEIAGRVLSSADGAPVKRPSLTFLHDGVAVAVDGDDAGRFFVRAPTAGAYELTTASARGFAAFEPALGHSPVTVWPRAGVRLEDITIYLTPTTELKVKVSDDKGKPLPAAEVRAFDERRGASEARVTLTNDKGVAEVTAQAWDTVEARKPGYLSARTLVSFTTLTSGHVALHLVAGAERARLQIGGHVVDGRGQPVDGALVEAYAPPAIGGDPPAGASTLSGADGRFTLAALDDAVYSVRATTRDAGGVIVRGVHAGATDVELELGAATAVLHGTVKDGAGRAIPAFTVVAWPREGTFGRGPEERATVVDSEGRYALPLPAGTYIVSAAARGYARANDRTVEVGDNGAEADFTLSKGSRIFGRVVERGSGAALAGAHVGFEGHAIDDPIGISTDATSGGDGSFALEGLPSGRQSLNVQAAGHNGRILGGLAVPTEGALGPLTIDLSPVAPGQEPTTEFVGIAAGIGARPEGMVITNIVPGGGASDAGLVAGDTILAIDGQSVEPLGFVGSIQMIRGPEDTYVTLVVRRADGSVQVMSVRRKRVSF